MSYYAGKCYEMLKKDLCDWVWHNPKLQHDLQFLFEFHPNRGLSIDLRRFEEDFYKATFYPPEEKKKHIDEFIRKLCIVIAGSLKRSGRPDLTITITVRHMISEASYWKTFFIDGRFDGRTLQPLNEKETDWYYPFP